MTDVALTVQAISLPELNVPIRQRDEYSSARTSVASPFAKYRAQWDNNNQPVSGSRQLLQEQYLAFAFRDPLRAIVRYNTNVGIQNSSYSWRARNASTGLIGVWILGQDMTQALEVVGAVPTTSFQPHGDFLFAGKYDGEDYMWVDGTSATPGVISITWAADPLATGKYEIWRYNRGAPVQVAEAVTVAATLNYNTNITTSDYYKVYAIQTNVAGNKTLSSIGQSSTCAIWEHHYLPGIYDNSDELLSIRMNAVAIRFSNNAAENFRSGRVVGLQVNPGEDWQGIAGAVDPFTKLMGLNGNRDRSFDKGLYGYLKPSSDRDFEMQVPFILDDFGMVTGNYNLKNQSPYLAVCSNVTVSDGRDAYISFFFNIEFNSNNTWFATLPPTLQPKDWEMAMEAIASMEQWYENPVHWRDILSTIGRVAKIAAPILSIFGPHGRVAGTIVGTAGEISEAVAMHKATKRRRR